MMHWKGHCQKVSSLEPVWSVRCVLAINTYEGKQSGDGIKSLHYNSDLRKPLPIQWVALEWVLLIRVSYVGQNDHFYSPTSFRDQKQAALGRVWPPMRPYSCSWCGRWRVFTQDEHHFLHWWGGERGDLGILALCLSVNTLLSTNPLLQDMVDLFQRANLEEGRKGDKLQLIHHITRLHFSF